MTATPAPSSDSGRSEVECRLEDIALTIQEFAALRFAARARIGPDGDLVDAIAAGVNFLGEELEASFKDIERKVADRTAELAAATRELAHHAMHDELTGLPNRTLFWDRLSQRLRIADRRPSSFAVLFVDLDDFKDINDSLGHAAGDRVLVGAASRIRSALRAGDSAARAGGDEFLVLLEDVASPEAALVIAQRLCDTLGAPYEIGAARSVAPASIGVAVSAQTLGTAEAMVIAADTAMYEAKRRGGGRCVLSNADHPA